MSGADEPPAEVFMSLCSDGLIHAFSSDEDDTAMCAAKVTSRNAGDDADPVCERCSMEMLAVLGVPAEGQAEIAAMFERANEEAS